MAYFPRHPEASSAYKCQGCNLWWIRGNVSCCVSHMPGACCHYGEQQTLPPQPVNAKEGKR